MDGWGLAEDPSVSAIEAADTPFYDQAIKTYPTTQLEASGLPVGLPDGQMGNSEVGHMNIGAGRIVYQMLVRINQDVQSGAFAELEQFQKLISYCKENNKPLHLMGLLSDGGVHSSDEHLRGILSLLAKEDLAAGVFVHAFTDGRDTDPHGGAAYVQRLQDHMQEVGCGKLASIIGRYFAMDRDKRWARTRKAYDLLVHGKGEATNDPVAALKASYEAGVTDEFIEPMVVTEHGQPVARLQAEDAVLFFNFRTDRGRQLTEVLTQQDHPEEEMKTLPLQFFTMTRYDDTFKDVQVLYEKDKIKNGMGEYLANLGKKQIRIAETEKYPHVTFFFNGGREATLPGEEYLLCPSPKVATYDLQPTMSAYEIRDKIIPRLKQEDVDFVCLNFANPDMVGHTGVFEAAVKACETVDACTREVAETAAEHGYKVIITADHGNSDRMRNPDGSPHTAHTTVPVPCILIDPAEEFRFVPGKTGKLGDLAPTLLTLMGLSVPEEMTGDILVEKRTVTA
jgi:2,3-bisphosphoglycerate-independent phosphoglycerate mutase